MNKTLNIKKGLDLKIAGGVSCSPDDAIHIKPGLVAMTADDFPGLSLKPVVKEGDSVGKGAPLMVDKHDPAITITSPVAGTIKAIVRGDRRKLERVIVEVGSEQSESVSYKFDLKKEHTPSKIKEILQMSGVWAFMRQRPYDIVPNGDASPRDIFISAIDTAPLAPDIEAILASKQENLAAGVKILEKLTDGDIYIGRRPGSPIKDIAGAIMVDINGPHPAGNPGILAANLKPVNKGEVIWTLDAITLSRIGHLALHGSIDSDTIVAVTGSEIKKPCYVKTLIGAHISPLINGNIKEDNLHKRIISGNPLVGEVVSEDLFLRRPYTQVTVIPNGDDVIEFLGWASLSPDKMSTSRTFPGHFMLKKLFKPDSRLLGGKRAIIMTGEYDKVVPMDILTEFLLKAIMSRDIEKMESLGIYEISPDDFALAEYVCTSKIPIQAIIADGLKFLRKELE